MHFYPKVAHDSFPPAILSSQRPCGVTFEVGVPRRNMIPDLHDLTIALHCTQFSCLLWAFVPPPLLWALNVSSELQKQDASAMLQSNKHKCLQWRLELQNQHWWTTDLHWKTCQTFFPLERAPVLGYQIRCCLRLMTRCFSAAGQISSWDPNEWLSSKQVLM